MRALAAPLLAALLAASATMAAAGVPISNPRQVSRDLAAADSLRSGASGPVVKHELGVSAGTPAGIDFVYGWWPHPLLGARVSGMAYGAAFGGVQGNFCVTMARGARTRLAFALIGGTIWSGSEAGSWFEDAHVVYFGSGFDVNLGALWLEVGLATGWNSDRDNHRIPVPLLQVGATFGGGVHGPR